jgi:molybdate transport system substrate-binding protein
VRRAPAVSAAIARVRRALAVPAANARVRRALAVAVALAIAAAPALAGTGCGDDAQGGSGDRTRVVVSAASSMTEALEACVPEFEEAEDADVRLSVAGSDELAAQIRQGAPVDAYAAADTSLPEQLHADGLLSEPVEFATNEFVLAVPAGSEIDSVEDAAEDGMKVVVGSESVPIGSYTREALGKLPAPQEDAILANVVSNEPDVKGIVGKLTQGAGDAGFVYVTDVKATGGALRAVDLPAALDPRVTYAAGVPRQADEPELGRSFVEGLRSGPCAVALEDAGFGGAP